MKTLLFAIALISPIARAAPVNFMTSVHVATAGFFAAVSKDCRNVFYSPLSYEFVEDETFILSRFVGEGAGRHPLIEIHFQFQPTESTPSDVQKAELIDLLLRQIDAPHECQFENPAFVPLVSANQTSFADSYFPEMSYPSVDVVSGTDFQTGITIEVDPRYVSLESILTKLKTLRLEKTFHLLENQIDASVTLDASYESAAEFYEKHYTERTCTYTEESHFLGGTSHSEDCSYRPIDVQLLKDQSIATGISMKSFLRHGTATEKLTALENQAMSRLALSLYSTVQKVSVGGISRVILGELHREISGEYHDYLSSESMRDIPFASPMTTPDLLKLAEPLLTGIYKHEVTP